MSKPRSQVTELCLLFNPAHKNACQGGIRRFSHFTALRLKKKWDHCSTRLKLRCPQSTLRQAHTALSCSRDPVMPGGGRPPPPPATRQLRAPASCSHSRAPSEPPPTQGAPGPRAPAPLPHGPAARPALAFSAASPSASPAFPAPTPPAVTAPSRRAATRGSSPSHRLASPRETIPVPAHLCHLAAARPDLPPARPGGCHIPPATQPRAHPHPPSPPPPPGRPAAPSPRGPPRSRPPPPASPPGWHPAAPLPVLGPLSPLGTRLPRPPPAVTLPAAGHAVRRPHHAPGRRPRRRGARGGNGSRRGREESRPRRAVPRREERQGRPPTGRGGREGFGHRERGLFGGSGERPGPSHVLTAGFAITRRRCPAGGTRAGRRRRRCPAPDSSPPGRPGGGSGGGFPHPQGDSRGPRAALTGRPAQAGRGGRRRRSGRGRRGVTGSALLPPPPARRAERRSAARPGGAAGPGAKFHSLRAATPPAPAKPRGRAGGRICIFLTPALIGRPARGPPRADTAPQEGGNGGEREGRERRRRGAAGWGKEEEGARQRGRGWRRRRAGSDGRISSPGHLHLTPQPRWEGAAPKRRGAARGGRRWSR